MKRILILFVSLVFFTACESGSSENTGTTSGEETTVAPSATSAPAMTAVDSAIMLLKDAQVYMEKGIRKEMPGPEVNEKMNPIMTHFQEIYKRLPPADTATIYQFRMKQFQEMVNLQVSMQKRQ